MRRVALLCLLAAGCFDFDRVLAFDSGADQSVAGDLELADLAADLGDLGPTPPLDLAQLCPPTRTWHLLASLDSFITLVGVAYDASTGDLYVAGNDQGSGYVARLQHDQVVNTATVNAGVMSTVRRLAVRATTPMGDHRVLLAYAVNGGVGLAGWDGQTSNASSIAGSTTQTTFSGLAILGTDIAVGLDDGTNGYAGRSNTEMLPSVLKTYPPVYHLAALPDGSDAVVCGQSFEVLSGLWSASAVVTPSKPCIYAATAQVGKNIRYGVVAGCLDFADAPEGTAPVFPPCVAVNGLIPAAIAFDPCASYYPVAVGGAGMYSSYDGNQWSTPANVTSGASDNLVDIVATPSGTLYAVGGNSIYVYE